MKLGYSLSSEEHSANDLVGYAKRAEEAGFSFALISDHYHPWIERQGHSPFVWSVIGGISQVTKQLTIGTGVTCPIFRVHPAIVAQAAATAATMLPGRFFLGLGTGENLNEHILGAHWPPIQTRQEMLKDAVKLMRQLWRGGNHNYRGRYFNVENAQLFDIPDKSPPIMIAAAGSESAELAGSLGDGLISTVPKDILVETFRASGDGRERPCYGQVHVCWTEREEDARKIVHDWWPVTAIPGKLLPELPTLADFEAAARLVTEEMVASAIVCGPDPNKHLAEIESFRNAGFDNVYVHQVGPDQEGFFRFYERQIIPKLH